MHHFLLRHSTKLSRQKEKEIEARLMSSKYTQQSSSYDNKTRTFSSSRTLPLTKPLPGIQKEIQLRHPLVLRQLLQQTQERILVRVRMRALGTRAQAAGSLVVEGVVRVVGVEIIVAGPWDACR